MSHSESSFNSSLNAWRCLRSLIRKPKHAAMLLCTNWNKATRFLLKLAFEASTSPLHTRLIFPHPATDSLKTSCFCRGQLVHGNVLQSQVATVTCQVIFWQRTVAKRADGPALQTRSNSLHCEFVSVYVAKWVLCHCTTSISLRFSSLRRSQRRLSCRVVSWSQNHVRPTTVKDTLWVSLTVVVLRHPVFVLLLFPKTNAWNGNTICFWLI